MTTLFLSLSFIICGVCLHRLLPERYECVTPRFEFSDEELARKMGGVL